MANKTQPTKVSPEDFLNTIEDEQKHTDAHWLLSTMAEITGEPGVMWGASIIGFGTYHYKYDSGREGDWMLTGFSPRKTALTLYLMSGVEREVELLKRLGKYKTGKSCLYIKKLTDVDTAVLRELIQTSVEKTRALDIRY